MADVGVKFYLKTVSNSIRSLTLILDFKLKQCFNVALTNAGGFDVFSFQRAFRFAHTGDAMRKLLITWFSYESLLQPPSIRQKLTPLVTRCKFSWSIKAEQSARLSSLPTSGRPRCFISRYFTGYPRIFSKSPFFSLLGVKYRRLDHCLMTGLRNY